MKTCVSSFSFYTQRTYSFSSPQSVSSPSSAPPSVSYLSLRDCVVKTCVNAPPPCRFVVSSFSSSSCSCPPCCHSCRHSCRHSRRGVPRTNRNELVNIHHPRRVLGHTLHLNDRILRQRNANNTVSSSKQHTPCYNNTRARICLGHTPHRSHTEVTEVRQLSSARCTL
jgi:hypothetical protein